MNPVSPRFTIVVSGYQNAPYLAKSLGSVKGQTFRDFEAICYVEESTDGSLDICRSLTADDPRFKVVSAPKSGAVAATRNYAIDHAAGEYLVVLDGDDWLAPDMLESLDARIREAGTIDVISFAAALVSSEDEPLDAARRISNFDAADASDVFTGVEAIRRSYMRRRIDTHSQSWICSYRTAFLREHRLYQSEGLIMEYFGWKPRVWFAAKRLVHIDSPLYAYRRRPGSIMSEKSGRIAVHVARQFRILAGFALGLNVPEDVMQIWSNEWVSMLYWFLFSPTSSRKVDRPARAQALKTVFDDGGFRELRAILRHASLPKRLLLPLLALARAGWHAPAIFFFRKIYYPLTERRAAKRT